MKTKLHPFHIVLNFLLDQSNENRNALTKWVAVTTPQERIHFLKKNVILIRFYERAQLKDPLLADAVAEEKRRIELTLKYINQIKSILKEREISFVFTKAFIHVPDMGHDIDLLIGDTSFRADRLLKERLSMRPDFNSIVNYLAGKRGYVVDGCPSELEIHHGRLGHAGEFYDYAQHVIKRANEGAPSDEDQLILRTLQRVYGHRSLRISDALNVQELLKKETLDWSYIRNKADELGVSKGFEMVTTQRQFVGNGATLALPSRWVFLAYLGVFWRQFPAVRLILLPVAYAAGRLLRIFSRR